MPRAYRERAIGAIIGIEKDVRSQRGVAKWIVVETMPRSEKTPSSSAYLLVSASLAPRRRTTIPRAVLRIMQIHRRFNEGDDCIEISRSCFFLLLFFLFLFSLLCFFFFFLEELSRLGRHRRRDRVSWRGLTTREARERERKRNHESFRMLRMAESIVASLLFRPSTSSVAPRCTGVI